MQFTPSRSTNFIPHLLPLEAREVPSAAATVSAHRLEIWAGDAGSYITLRDNGLGQVTALVQAPQQTATAVGNNITSIVIHGGAGNDIVDLRTTGTLRHLLDLDADLGDGNDRVRLDFTRGVANARVNVDLTTGKGIDSVDTRVGAIRDSKLNVTADLGAGADAGSFVLFEGLAGSSTLNVDYSGGTGNDRIDINLMGSIATPATASIRITGAGDSGDRAAIRYRGELDGRLGVTLDHAASTYGVQTRFTLDAGSTGELGAVVHDQFGTRRSKLNVIDATTVKVSVLDRFTRTLTQPPGTRL